MKTDSVFLRPKGKSYRKIFYYFLPELITTLIIYSFLDLFDAKQIANLSQSSLYATQGVTRFLVRFFSRPAEGLLIGTIILCGRYNGRKSLKKVGVAVVSSFWLSFMVGLVVCSFLYFGSAQIYAWYGLPTHMIKVGVPFLRTRAIGLFFMFLYFSFMGFLRSIKNTYVPMILFVFGGLNFMFFDWALINGRCGFSAYHFQGSSIAFLIQYFVMCVGVLLYFILNKNMRVYGIHLLRSFRLRSVFKVLKLSWPVMVDKGAIAWSRLWLVPMLATTGEWAFSGYTVINDLHLLARVPVLALAQVLTFLISNDVGAGNWKGARKNIKKVFLLSGAFMFIILFFFSWNSYGLIKLFDKSNNFVGPTVSVFLFVSIFSILEIFPMIFSAALRGSGDVRSVMIIRLLACFFLFVPISKFLSVLHLNYLLKFILIYASFYFVNCLSGLFFAKRLNDRAWRKRFYTKDRGKKPVPAIGVSKKEPS